MSNGKNAWRRLAFVLALAVAAADGRGEEPPTKEDLARGALLSPRAFREAAEAIRPALVRIETFGGLEGVAKGGRNSFVPGEGPTTGLVLSADGFIVTSTFNFLNKPPVITVVLPDGERHVAQLLGRDDTRKLCLLKIATTRPLVVPTLAPRDELKVGQWAIALGVGFGDKTPALSAGIISATSRIGAKAVQTDANLSPANYGGPLVDIEGRVIGICVPLSPESSEAAAGAEWYDSGIGFAAPLTGIDKILQSLKEGKTLSPPFLGIQSKPAEKFAPGAIVAEIVPESAAAKAGLAKGDVITAVEGTAALDPTHLSSLIRRYVAGDEVTFTVTRGSENKEIRATLGTVPPPPKKPPAKEGEPKKPDAPQPPMKPPPPKM